MPKSNELNLKDFVKIIRTNDFTKFSEQMNTVMKQTVQEESAKLLKK
ncbi:tail tube protein [Rhizobium phage RL38J1]|uniref:Tail tube protein n=1 Tax=Rhizobium phage RL38J1 TaxID=2663232 RepID=A0A6B9J1M4_9CAUD|nr:tail tube protein [Rhizobium phage RL38J1]QGZ14097.1 tail tube protein [Rhizobium phage RL38J1]